MPGPQPELCATMDAKDRIQHFLEDKLLVEFNDQVTDDVNLFRVGAVDSFGLAELVVFMEKEFNITIDNEELLGGHFTTLKGMAEFVEQRR